MFLTATSMYTSNFTTFHQKFDNFFNLKILFFFITFLDSLCNGQQNLGSTFFNFVLYFWRWLAKIYHICSFFGIFHIDSEYVSISQFLRIKRSILIFWVSKPWSSLLWTCTLEFRL